jgi:uncharacterized protein with HEPN domain
MTEIERKYLADIAIAISHIENFVSGLSFQHYTKIIKLKALWSVSCRLLEKP